MILVNILPYVAALNQGNINKVNINCESGITGYYHIVDSNSGSSYDETAHINPQEISTVSIKIIMVGENIK